MSEHARVGLIGRCDTGGLGTMTYEFARHVECAAILVVDLADRGRPGNRPLRYDGLMRGPYPPPVTPYPPSDGDVAWLAERCDVIYTAEVGYHPRLRAIARAHDCRVVLHAMPELFRREDALNADEVWLPSPWRVNEATTTAHSGTVGAVREMPVPIALDRFDRRQRDAVDTILHVGGPAMVDRNGTELFREALLYVQAAIVARVAGVDGADQWTAPNVSIQHVPRVEHYWQRYQHEVDLLVQPRRYGGLSLLSQEAAAAGVPTLALDRDPERLMPWAIATVPVSHTRSATMAGGEVDVCHASPLDLAAKIDEAVVMGVRHQSANAAAWAQVHSWANLADVYRAALDQAARG